ncbi:MAG: RNA-protein complex protein Nop10 [Candidatus Thorarchaeota archaeon]
MTLLYKCTQCNEYTLEEDRCPYCGGEVYNPLPAKFSPQDKYGEYRRAAKKKARQYPK